MYLKLHRLQQIQNQKLCFPGPQLTLIKIDKELEPWSEGARNEEGVEGGAEMSVVDFAVGVGLEAKASWRDAVGV